MMNLEGFLFPLEWVKAALVLALICIWMVITLFAYLNRHTKRPYFNLWIAAWIFYSVYLAAAIGLQESPDTPILILARRACIGVSALFMFWGSFHLTYRPRSNRELAFATVMLILWSAVAVYLVRDPFWMTMPVFALLGTAGIYTGGAYLSRRSHYTGATILGIGFLCWGLHLLAFPLLEKSPLLMTIGYLASAVLALMIAIGMVVEQEVTVAEKNYRVLFDSASEGIFLVDIWTLRILEANSAALRFTKYAASDLVGHSFLDICPSLRPGGANAGDHQKMFAAVFRPFSEFPVQQADGTQVLCEGETAVVEWQQRLVLQVNVREIGERKKVGQQLRRAEKLSALGQLVAGVAHELNNPLAVVMGSAQLLATRDSLDDKTRKDIARIQRESERATNIVRDLLAFARPSEPQKVGVDINRLVAGLIESREAELLAADIRVEKRLAASPLKTMADISQVEQVLINLITNAIHALADRPWPRRLTVTTENAINFIRISVADNGPGIAQQIVGKIFDPFFTTKPSGKGTGLGLTISSTIVKEHRGKIWVETEPGCGAKFFVELPILPCDTEALSPQPASDPSVLDSATGDHRLLIVDDEPGIVEVLEEVLRASGYTVETASNGMHAIQRLSAGCYDLIITDMRMPDMDGEKLYQTVRTTMPALANRIVFLTGDTVSPHTRLFLESTGNRWVSKPFHIKDILQVVQDVLPQVSAPVSAAT